jgi:hypothetical protein
MKPAVVVTGCGRSGTMYMSKYFQAMGLDVRHEKHGEDGISSWYISEGWKSRATKNYYGSKLRKIVAIHLVRDPLKVMSSMRRCEAIRSRSALDPYRVMAPQHAHAGVEELAARYWVDWNRLARITWNFDYTLRIEDADNSEVMLDMARLLGVTLTGKIVQAIREIPKNTHFIKEKFWKEAVKTNPVCREDMVIEDIPYLVQGQVCRLASLFGYSLNSEFVRDDCQGYKAQAQG